MAQKIAMKQLANEILNVLDILAFVSEEKITDWKVETVLSAGDLELKSKEAITAEQIENLKTIYILSKDSELIEGVANIISYDEKTGEYTIIARKFGDGTGLPEDFEDKKGINVFKLVSGSDIEDTEYLTHLQKSTINIPFSDLSCLNNRNLSIEDVQRGDLVFYNRVPSLLLGHVMAVSIENQIIRVMMIKKQPSIIKSKKLLSTTLGDTIYMSSDDTDNVSCLPNQLFYDDNYTIGVFMSYEDTSLTRWKVKTIAVPNITITTTEIDSDETSATYGHLMTTLSDGRTIDAGNALGLQGPKGDGFAISKIYENQADILAETKPVSEGAMIALVTTDASGNVNAYIYIRKPGYVPVNPNDLNDYIFFCDLSEATVIRGPQGPQGIPGVKGDNPVVTTTPIAATSTMPAGTRVTFTTGTGAATQVVSFDLYNGKDGTKGADGVNGTNGTNGVDGADGLSITNVEINSTNHLIVTMSDSSTIDAGEVSNGTTAGGCVTLLGCFATAPATCAKDDMYYNTTTKKIQKATTANKWSGSSTPKENTLYISKADTKVYVWTDGDMVSYGGGSSDITISQYNNNAIVELDDGIYVQNLKEDIKNINIAQKTVNELGYESLINKSINIDIDKAPTTMGDKQYGFDTNVDKEIPLLKDIEQFNFIKMVLKPASQNGTLNFCPSVTKEIKVSDVKYNTSSTNHNAEDVFLMTIGLDDNAVPGTIASITLKGWFKNKNTFYVNRCRCSYPNTWNRVIITDIIGIKKEVITVDPVNYIEEASSIEGIPVGTRITTIGKINPPKYLAEDGSEYNIADYPELAQTIKELYGEINAFGGDGVTTFKVPYDKDTAMSAGSNVITDWYSPAYTSAADSTAFATKPKLTTSGRYDSTDYYAPWKAFNRIFGSSQQTSGQTGFGFPPINNASTDPKLYENANNWLQLEFKEPKTFEGFRVQARPTYEKEMLSRFNIEVSMDGINWTTVHKQDTKLTGATVPVKNTWYEVTHKQAMGKFWRISHCECYSAYTTGGYHTWVEEAEIKLSDAVVLPCKYIKAKKDVMIKSINGYEEVTELLSTPIEIPSVSKEKLKYIVVSKGSTTDKDICFAYITEAVGSEHTLDKSYANFDEIEIVAYGINPANKERFNRITKRIRVKDLIYSDSTAFDDGSIDLQFSAISSGYRDQQLRLNFKTDKKTLTVVQTNYYQGPVERASIVTWTSIVIDKVRGINHKYKIEE